MTLNDLLSPQCVAFDIRARDKRSAIEAVASAAARQLDLPPKEVLDAVLAREAKGSTGFGGGVAIPHGRIEGLGRVVGYFARLASPVDFDSVDGVPVDLVFLLLAPESATAAHLKALARVSRLFRDAELRASLRKANSPDALFVLADAARIRAA
ncbi:MAG: PTS sugar transporter subunit IIA [Parvularculaceae bacterium]|nr:PTS sugar transporter subunit IIA [Parvularculaceae bacterium]